MVFEWIKLIFVTAALSASFLPLGEPNYIHGGDERTVEHYTLTTGRGPVEARETRTENEAAAARTRTYTLYNGDTVTMGSTEAKETVSDACVAVIELPSRRGGVRWYDAEGGTWRAAPLGDMRIQAGCVLVSTLRGEALVYTPKMYESLGSGTLRRDVELSGSIQLRLEDESCRVEVLAAGVPEGHTAEYMLVESAGKLFEDENALAAWTNCTMDNDRLWCYDGCYHPSPSNYKPAGENCYYRVPAAYFTRLVEDNAPEIRAAEDLAASMLDVLCKQQNEHGYFPTLPESEWLSGDYHVGGGFYDTRFNSDLAEIFCNAASWLGCKEYAGTMNRYFNFFLSYAGIHHTATANGILVWDYYDPQGGGRTHTSLNHQAAEILALYHWAAQSGRDDLRVLAGRMFAGLEDTASNWIRPDRNLHYAVYPQGGYGGTDYPFLTYNDLYDLRGTVERQGRSFAALQPLMDAKLEWMEANRVTDYKK